MARLGKKEREAIAAAKKESKYSPSRKYKSNNKDRSKESGLKARGGSRVAFSYTTTINEPVIDSKTGQHVIDSKGNKVYRKKELIVGSYRHLESNTIRNMVNDKEHHGLSEDVLDKYSNADRSRAAVKVEPVAKLRITSKSKREANNPDPISGDQKLLNAVIDAQVWKRLTTEEQNFIIAKAKKGEGDDMYPQPLRDRIAQLKAVVLDELKQKVIQSKNETRNVIEPVFPKTETDNAPEVKWDIWKPKKCKSNS